MSNYPFYKKKYIYIYKAATFHHGLLDNFYWIILINYFFSLLCFDLN